MSIFAGHPCQGGSVVVQVVRRAHSSVGDLIDLGDGCDGIVESVSQRGRDEFHVLAMPRCWMEKRYGRRLSSAEWDEHCRKSADDLMLHAKGQSPTCRCDRCTASRTLSQ